MPIRRIPTTPAGKTRDEWEEEEERRNRRMKALSNGISSKRLMELNAGVGAGPLGEGEEDAYRAHRLDVDPELLEDAEMYMLAGIAKFKTSHFIIPRKQPMDLLDLKVMFSTLRKRSGVKDTNEKEDQLPFEAFQRAFERLFYVMQDPVQFDAKAYDENGDGFVAWGEFYRVYKKRNITVELSLAERIYLTFDSPEASGLSQLVSVLLLFTIMVSSACFILSTLPECHTSPADCENYETIERVCLLIFVVEFLVRACTVGAARTELHDKTKLQELVAGWDPITVSTPLGRLWRFLCTPANIIDMVAIIPGVVGYFAEADGGAFLVLRLIRLTRIFRALRSPTLIAPLIVIGRTLEKSTKALEVLAFNLCLGIVMFGSLMFLAEGGDDLSILGIGGRWNETSHLFERSIGMEWDGDRWQPVWAETPFQSIPESFWWAAVTAATVGYGDHSPTTMWGQVVAGATMLFSMLILALPVGVMGGTFTQEWEAYQAQKRRRAMMLKREMAYITRAVKSLDPAPMSRLMLFEVWHDHPFLRTKLFHRPPASVFIGHARVELELPPDRPVSNELKLKLESNPDLVKRRVSGFIIVRYEWTPREDAAKGMLPLPSDAAQLELHGTLTVTAIRGENLVNISCDGHQISPYITMLCYPTYTHKDGPLPYCVRTPAVKHTCKPQWDIDYTFKYEWTDQGGDRHLPECKEDPGADDRREASRLSNQRGASPSPDAKLEAALGALRQAAWALRSQRADLKQVRDEVRGLKRESPSNRRHNQKSGELFSSRGFSDSESVMDGDDSVNEGEARGGALQSRRLAPPMVLLPGMPGE